MPRVLDTTALALQPFCIVSTFAGSQIAPPGRLCGHGVGAGYVPLGDPPCGCCTRGIYGQLDDETTAHRDLYR